MSGVELDREGAVGICRIDEPETRNALTAALMESVGEALAALDADPEIRTIVLAGTEDVFATGAEVRTLGVEPEAPIKPPELWTDLIAIDKPLVAAVSGWALGPGFELAMACDLIVASKAARFGQPETTLGLIPGGGATQRLTRALGKQRAMELILTGRRMGAEQAHAYGLVNQVTDKRRWFESAVRLAAQIAERGPLATRLAKRAILAAEREGLDEGLETERRLLARAMASEDRDEGLSAFLEGRAPRFSGR